MEVFFEVNDNYPCLEYSKAKIIKDTIGYFNCYGSK